MFQIKMQFERVFSIYSNVILNYLQIVATIQINKYNFSFFTFNGQYKRVPWKPKFKILRLTRINPNKLIKR